MARFLEPRKQMAATVTFVPQEMLGARFWQQLATHADENDIGHAEHSEKETGLFY
jgi:hypothetical protein